MKENNSPIKFPSMLTISEASAQSGLSPYTLRKLCRSGQIRFVACGCRWLVNGESLARFLECGSPAASDPRGVESARRAGVH